MQTKTDKEYHANNNSNFVSDTHSYNKYKQERKIKLRKNTIYNEIKM